MKLRVAGISFAYGSRPVLDEVSFAVEPGRFAAVLGNNGAGKSTLLRCIARILEPRSGSVWLGADDIHSLSGTELAKLLGYVPQRSEATRMAVYDTVLVGRRPHITWNAGPRDHAVVEHVIGQLKLEELALRPIDELSGGELQKVMIARALAQEPSVLLLDEPTSSLDLRNQLDVLTAVRSVTAEKGVAVIAVMHDLNLALRFADALILLSEGRVHASGGREVITPESVSEVYGVGVSVTTVNGRPVVVPL